jgi:BioD-like phosphotransacetylase family protein
VAAVAALSDVACVTLTESVSPDPELLSRAKAQGITLLGTSKGTYDAAVALAQALKEQ